MSIHIFIYEKEPLSVCIEGREGIGGKKWILVEEIGIETFA